MLRKHQNWRRKMDNKVVVGIVTLGDEILLVKRKPGEGALLWQFPGGSAEDGETIEEAVVRELKEETGADVKVLKVIGERVHPYTKKHMAYVACEYIGGDLEVHDEDLEKAQWAKIAELSLYFTTPLYEKVGIYLNSIMNK